MSQQDPETIAALRRRRRLFLLLIAVLAIPVSRKIGLAVLEGNRGAATVLDLQDELKRQEAEHERLLARRSALDTPAGRELEVRRGLEHVRPGQRMLYFGDRATPRQALEPLVRGRPRSEDPFEVLEYWWQTPHRSTTEK